MRFGSTAKLLAKCKLEYYRISECLKLCIVGAPWGQTFTIYATS